MGTVEHLLGNALDVLVVGAGPAGVAAGDRGPPARPRRARGRQGRLPPRQDLRRRPHHRSAAPARRPRRRRPEPAVVRTDQRDRARVAHRPRGGRAPSCRRRVRGRRAARRARCRARRPRPRRGASKSASRRGHRARDDGAESAATLADGSIVQARWLVAADGHYSPDAQAARRRGRRSRRPRSSRTSWHAFRQYFTRRRRPPPLGAVRGGLPPRLRVGVPAWADGRANVGFGVLRDRHADAPSGKALAAQWRDARRPAAPAPRLGPDAEPEGTERAWPIPAAYDGARLTARARAVRRGRRRRRRPDDR